MPSRTGPVLLALILAGCTTNPSPSPAPSAGALPTARDLPSSAAPTPAGGGQPGSAGYLLMELTNSTSEGRYTDLVALDPASGALLLAPWTAADGWALDTARWSADGAALLLGNRMPTAEGALPVLRWSEEWLDPARPARPILFDAVQVFDVAASRPDGAWFSGTSIGEDGSRHTVFRHADGSGTDGQASAGQVAWSPASREAVILTRGDRLIQVEPQTLTTRTLAESVRYLSSSVNDPQVLWSPDGLDVLYRADACGLCIQTLATGAVRTLDTSGAGDVFEVHAWTPFGLVARLSDTGEMIVLSADDGAVRRVLGAIGDTAVSPGGDRLIGLELEAGASSMMIVDIDLSTGTEERYAAPTGVILRQLQWQPTPVEVPWPAWTPPGPDATPPLAAGALELVVSGAFTASTNFAALCETRDSGLAITGSDGDVGAQVGVSADGAPNFLSVNGSGFAAFAGKGFEVAPPFVIGDAGSTLASGSLSFSELPNIDAAGVINGTLRWTCPPP